ncbi:MAG: hypothetical protein WC787_03925 [Patescibacteria group bacterium]|jgi:hypothetical protein
MLIHSRALLFCSIFALSLSIPACGDGGTGGSGNDGEGGGACDSDCGGDGPGNGGSGLGSNTGGNPNACTPTFDNLTCEGAATCNCAAMTAMPAEAACPNQMGNVCTPGHNQCGCDLPVDTDYVPADEECVSFVNGDTWQDVTGQFFDTAGWDYNDNGQRQIGFGSLFLPEDDFYYTGLIMSGRSLQWNLANPMLERCDGIFTADCLNVTLRCYHGSETSAYAEGTLYHVSQ